MVAAVSSATATVRRGALFDNPPAISTPGRSGRRRVCVTDAHSPGGASGCRCHRYRGPDHRRAGCPAGRRTFPIRGRVPAHVAVVARALDQIQA